MEKFYVSILKKWNVKYCKEVKWNEVTKKNKLPIVDNRYSDISLFGTIDSKYFGSYLYALSYYQIIEYYRPIFETVMLPR